jgi:hypothetical protein
MPPNISFNRPGLTIFRSRELGKKLLSSEFMPTIRKFTMSVETIERSRNLISVVANGGAKVIKRK